MSQPAVNPYLRTKIMTASSEELRLLLYDGAIKFCHHARSAIADVNFEDSYNSLMRAQKIVLELSTSLKHDVDPDLCGKLSALYTFIYRKLVDANVNRDPEAIEEAIKLLEYERQTWQMLMKRLAETAAKAAPGGEGSPPIDGARQTAISSFSKSA